MRRLGWAIGAMACLAAARAFAAAPEAPAQRLQAMGLEATVDRLIQYAAQGDATTVDLILAAGVPAGAADARRQVTALHNAAAQGHLRIVERLLALGAAVDPADWRGATPLIDAAYYAHDNVLALLLQHGADVNAKPAHAPTALVSAVLSGDAKVLERLLGAGADPALADAYGVTPLAAAERATAPRPRGETPVTLPKLLALALLAVAPPLAAAPILDYPALGAGAKDLPALSAPVSAFHDDADAQAAASKIRAAWASEPASLAWTRVQLERHIKHKASPTRAARGLALMHVAMHDAYDLAGGAGLDRRLALSMAAATVLGYLYTAEEHAFDRIAFDLAGQLSGSVPDQLPPPVQRALALGRAVGERVVARAQDDGAQRGWNGSRLQWYGDGRYYGPDAWEPTPPYFYYPPDEPFAPGWKTWVLARADQFRPAPPEFESEKYLRDLKEVIDISRGLTPEQLRIAKFWVDGHGSVTPPGHWNQIAIDAVKAAKLDEARVVDLFADLNIAMADAFIATWDCKYHYWTMRPVTAAKKVYGVDYQPAILTPPFPSYPSGHASFSGAAARILGAYLPDQAQRYDAMALEAATSRMYGGIHYRHDNEDGLELGRKVAGAVLAKGRGAP